MFNYSVQVVAEQINDAGLYIHIDTQYFSDPTSIRDWLSGAVEWADRFRIFKVGTSEYFFEGIVIQNVVPEWKKLRVEDHEVIDLYV